MLYNYNGKEEKMIHIRLEEDLKKQLQKEAKEKGLTLCAYIRMLLIERKK